MSTALSLEEFRKEVGFHPYHFWQLADNAHFPITAKCNRLTFKYSWMDTDIAGRKEMGDAIKLAEQRLRNHLHFPVAPTYFEDTYYIGCFLHNRTNFVHWEYGPGILASNIGPLLAVGSGRLLEIGTEAWSKLATITAPALILGDNDGDGLNDYFSFQYVDNGVFTDLSKVGVFFNDLDWLPEDQFIEDIDKTVLENYQIRPIRVKRIDAITIAISGPRYLLVKPALYERLPVFPGIKNELIKVDTSGAYDPTQDSNFVSSLDLYQRVTTNANQITVDYRDYISGAITSVNFNAYIYEDQTGLIRLTSTCNGGAVPCGCNGSPQTLRINYRAGEALEDWRAVVVRLALAELKRPISGCESANREAYKWQFDLARAAGTLQEQYSISPEDLANPLGTSYGQVWAWKWIKLHRMIRAITI